MMVEVILHQIKGIVTYRYEKRIIILLSQIIECCKELQHSEKVCDACKVRIAKCSRLVKRGQMPISYYIVMVNHIVNG